MLELTAELSRSLDQAAEFILRAKHVVALAGAGLSVESGIPTFRGPGGLWTKYGEPTNLSYREFTRDPGEWWEARFRNEDKPGDPTYELKVAVDQAEPNPGHHALVEMERLGLLQSVVTQNVDNLHREAGSKSLLEIHGNRTWLRCIGCGVRQPRDGYHFDSLPPICTHCRGVIKMDTVMFGEPIPEDVLLASREQAEACDCMLLVGTSGTVNPAARLPLVAKELGATLIEINPDKTTLTPHCDITLNGPSGELLPLLLKRLRNGGQAEPGNPA
jgi:NAD-dependent deacetylase